MLAELPPDLAKQNYIMKRRKGATKVNYYYLKLFFALALI
jgi:hypothetical protein